MGDRPDHGVSIIGWGIDEVTGFEYYILRNMWGPRWGEEGYARIAMDKTNCGVFPFASIPTTNL